MNSVKPNTGITIILAIKRNLKLETCSPRSGSWTMMKRKKQSIWAEVTCALARIWFGEVLKDGQIASSMVWMHCPPWKLWVPNPVVDQYLRTFRKPGVILGQATTPRTRTAKNAPYIPKVDLIKSGKLMPYMHPIYPFNIAGTQTRRYPTSTATTMDNPGLSPLVIADEATWYIEMLKASATQKPSREGHVHLRSSDSKGTGSRSLFEASPFTPLANEPGWVCNRKGSKKAGTILELQSLSLNERQFKGCGRGSQQNSTCSVIKLCMGNKKIMATTTWEQRR